MKLQKRKATIDDGMNPELVKGTDFDGYLGIPTIRKPETVIIPTAIVPFTARNRCSDLDVAVAFYEKDPEFAEVLIAPEHYIDEFCHRPLISPDCSLYRDAPLAVQITNVYRNRAIGYYYQSRGAYVIPQVRWGNALTYQKGVLPEPVAFLGVEKHSIVAVGNYGCFRTRDDKYHFQAGLEQMLVHLEPIVVLVYGSDNQGFFRSFLNDTQFVFYDNWISRKKGGDR